MKNEEPHNIPKNWVWMTVESISLKVTDGSHNPPKKEMSGVPMLSAKNVNDDVITFNDVRYITPEDFLKEQERTKIEFGDVLLTIVATIGRCAIVSESLSGKFAIQRSVALIKPAGILGKYLMYYFQSPYFQQLLNDNAKGTAQRGVYLKTLNSLPVPITTLDEQARIVDKIEVLFSELGSSVETLKHAKAKLELYRQVILKHAFDGKLTNDWRIKNESIANFEGLQQIGKERRSDYEKQWKYWKEHQLVKGSSEVVRKPSLPKEFQANEHLILPQEWSQDAIGNICVNTSSINTSNKEANSHFIYIDIGSINNFKVVDYKELAWKNAPSRAKHKLKVGDTLVSTVRTNLKNVAYVDKQKFEKAVGSSGFAVLRPTSLINPKYVFYYCRSDIFINKLTKLQSGTSYPAVRDRDVFEQTIPLCSHSEQEQIVEIIESQFSIIENLEVAIENDITKAEILKRSILKKAFEGNLCTNSENKEIHLLLYEISEKKAQYIAYLKALPKLPKKPKMSEKKLTILEILKSSDEPISAKELWERSSFNDNIELFYAELKKIEINIQEKEKGFLSFVQ